MDQVNTGSRPVENAPGDNSVLTRQSMMCIVDEMQPLS